MAKTSKFMLVLMLLTPLVALAEEKAQKHDEAEKKAVESADAWLPVVDQERFGDSWEAASAYLKNAASKDSFTKSLNGARKPLGKMTSRKLKSKEFKTSLQGAPDGQYVVIQYETSFEHKKSAVETITPMLEKDGTWKVSGYYIK